MTTKKTTWLRDLAILIVGTIVGGVVVVLVDKTLLRERALVASPPPPFEFVTRNDMERSINDAKTKLEATGYVLKTIDPDFINNKMKLSPSFTARIVMIDPLSSKRIICQRQYDEDNKPRNYSQILDRVKEFIQKSKSSIGNRLQVGLSDAYPTMTVIIVDDDLYAYFFPYHGLGSDSPIVRFRNYHENERAQFFETHLKKVLESAKFLTKEADYKRYESANSNDPCF